MKKYPKYKPSGVDWLGEIPIDWKVWKVSRLFKKIGSGTTPKSGTPEYYENGTIPWINTGDLNDGYINDCSTYITKKAFDDHSTLKIYEAGTLLVAMYGATIGKIAITKFEACTNQACCSLVRSKLIDTKFAFYWFLANKENIINLSYGGGQPNISQDIVRSLKIPICNITEQHSIVRFLDYKTGQIDRFIANRQKQIELLKEQKVSIINFAITRGINKNTKLKKSETDTLDYYPEHWKLTKLKYLLKKKRAAIRTGPFGTQLKNSDLKEDGEIKIYNQRSVIDKNFINGTEYISLEKYNGLKDFIVNPNDLLITTRGTIGKCAIFPPNMEIGVLHPCLIRMQLDERIISNEYAMICLENALFFQEEIKLLSNSTVIEVIYSYNLKEVFLPIPPVEEQNEILAYIKTETSTIETLISKYQKQIDLMQEYRTSLISQAVTGKIDVRDWQPKARKYQTEELPISIAAEK